MARLFNFDYKSPFFYMVTLKRLPGMSDFSTIGEDGRLVKNAITEAFEKTIRTFHRKWRCIEAISPFVVMPDHIHLIVFVKNAEGEIEKGKIPANERIPQIVSAFKRLTQKELGKKIFQRGYYDHVIRDDKDFDIKWRYIDENPANWLENKKYREMKEKINP